MDIVVLGAGALGSIIAAHLQIQGHNVAVLARGARATQVEQDGLKIHGLADIHTRCKLITDPETLSNADLLIVTVKTYDNHAALAALPKREFGGVFSVANGVSKNAQLLEHFGPDRVLGCMANTSGELEANGDVIFTRNVCLHLGEIDGSRSARASQLVSVLNEAGINTRLEDDITGVEWSKYVGWTALFALSVTTRLTTPNFLANRRCASLAVAVIKEMGAIAKAVGVRVIDQPPIPVARVIAEPMERAAQILIDIGNEWKRSAPEHRMSSLQDLQRGKRLEVDETLGYALALAREQGVAAPQLATFYKLAAALNDELIAV